MLIPGEELYGIIDYLETIHQERENDMLMKESFTTIDSDDKLQERNIKDEKVIKYVSLHVHCEGIRITQNTPCPLLHRTIFLSCSPISSLFLHDHCLSCPYNPTVTLMRETGNNDKVPLSST